MNDAAGGLFVRAQPFEISGIHGRRDQVSVYAVEVNYGGSGRRLAPKRHQDKAQRFHSAPCGFIL
jgi:hypothetical protein